jgi:hypothetical protein
MPQFSRKTLLAATDTLTNYGHADIDRFLLEHSLEKVASTPGTSKQSRANELARFLVADPERTDENGRNIQDVIVEALVQRALDRCTGYCGFDSKRFEEQYGSLFHGLERDGFSVQDGHLRRALPELLDLPRADDEVHALLDAYGFSTPKGHLDQAIDAHARGQWAAANAQFRPFVESLLDEIAEHLLSTSQLPPPGHQRRQWLANLDPPFFIGSLNEWIGDGKGFIEAFYRRLHPQGSHPGLSDVDDSTFRLHLVLLVARLLLVRFKQRIQP